jgi:hypothetical protein
MKRKPQTAVIILIVLAMLGCWGYYSIAKGREREKQRAERQAQTTAKIKAFVRHYHAITGWENGFLDTDRNIFSLELEDALVNTEGKPIFISEPIHDVARHGDRFFLYVHGPESTFRFVLECSQEMARRVAKHPAGISRYVIVAQIDSVEKTDTRLRFQDAPEEDEQPVGEETSDLFYARGRCLDVLLIDEEWPLSVGRNWLEETVTQIL